MKWETALWMVACLLFASLPRGQADTTCHAFVGDTVILPCTTTSPGELILSNSILYWQIGHSVLVHFFDKGNDSLGLQDERYNGRTSLFLDQMKHGNFSLKLSNVQLLDTHIYTCIYKQTGDHPKQTQKSKINLIVSAPPNIEEPPFPSGRGGGSTPTSNKLNCSNRLRADTTAIGTAEELVEKTIYRLIFPEKDLDLNTYRKNFSIAKVRGSKSFLTCALHPARVAGHSQISSRIPADAPCLAMLPLAFHLLVALAVWHL